jgi:RimJ/RimL family protein N-acetyltransferase
MRSRSCQDDDVGEAVELETERLRLRRWTDADRDPYAVLNADPIVMEHFVAPLSRAESDAHVDRIEAFFAEHGWGLWAAERRDTGTFIGFIGLGIPRFDAAFLPGVEVGWRLAKEHWGQGFAPEGAKEALRFAFEDLALPEVLSFTAVANTNSRRVMEKIGMVHDPADDFDHPSVPEGHRIRRHVLYRITPQRLCGDSVA